MLTFDHPLPCPSAQLAFPLSHSPLWGCHTQHQQHLRNVAISCIWRALAAPSMSNFELDLMLSQSGSNCPHSPGREWACGGQHYSNSCFSSLTRDDFYWMTSHYNLLMSPTICDFHLALLSFSPISEQQPDREEGNEE